MFFHDIYTLTRDIHTVTHTHTLTDIHRSCTRSRTHTEAALSSSSSSAKYSSLHRKQFAGFDSTSRQLILRVYSVYVSLVDRRGSGNARHYLRPCPIAFQ